MNVSVCQDSLHLNVNTWLIMSFLERETDLMDV